jgi:uncharacterized protein
MFRQDGMGNLLGAITTGAGDPAWVQGLVGLGGCALGIALGITLAIVEWAAWVLVLPSRRPGTIGEQMRPAEGQGEAIEAVAADGVKLAGVWYRAEGSKEQAVLVIHGFAEDPAAMRERVEALNRHGWDVAALDARAHGRSGGELGSFGGREAADVAAWVEALTKAGKIGAGPLAIWGRSMGAAVAVRAVADHVTRDVNAIVLEAIFLDLKETLKTVIRRRRVPLAGMFAILVLRRAKRLAGVSLARPRPIDLAAKVETPVLIVHGTEDGLIPVADARRLSRAFPKPAEFLEVSGAGHGDVVDVGGAELLERVAAFLDGAV